ncbi:MAG: T9SS type A sorting domain-containing protein [Flavobacteriales bacterium]
MHRIILIIIFLLSLNGSAQVWQMKGSEISGSAFDGFGRSSCLSGDGTVLAIGSDHFQNSLGIVYTYRWNGSAWIPLGNEIKGQHSDGKFGSDVKLSYDGKTLMVTSINKNPYVRVYRWDGTDWKLKGSSFNAGGSTYDVISDRIDMSADGNTVIVGNYAFDDTVSAGGQVIVYEWANNTWKIKGQTFYGETEDIQLGKAVSISGDAMTIAIMDRYEFNEHGARGRVMVYRFNGIVWQQIGNQLMGVDINDAFGAALNLSYDGNTLASSSSGYDVGNNPNAGRLHAYHWTGATWVDEALLGFGLDGEDYFGDEVFMNEEGTIIAGTSIYQGGPGSSTSNVGMVAVYKRSGNTWTLMGQRVYGQSSNEYIGFSLGMNAEGTSFVTTSWEGFARVYELTCEQSGEDHITVCDSLTWIDGNKYYADNNTATHWIDTAGNCDSALKELKLHVINSTFYTDVVTSCLPYEWIDGNTYFPGGPYAIANLVNEAGCDSVLSLLITDQVDTTVYKVAATLYSVVDSATTYQWIDCSDSSLISGATEQSYTPSVNGFYRVAIIHNGCADTSGCKEVNNVGIDEEANMAQLMVYPNPSDGSFIVSGIEPGSRYSIYNALGQPVMAGSFQSSQEEFVLDKGYYLIQVNGATQSQTVKAIVQ